MPGTIGILITGMVIFAVGVFFGMVVQRAAYNHREPEAARMVDTPDEDPRGGYETPPTRNNPDRENESDLPDDPGSRVK